MDYKKFTTYSIVGFFCVGILCFGINYFADSYGLYDTHNKRLENLVNPKTSLYKDRINAKAPCYVVGSSRVLDLDFSMLSKLSNTHCIGIAIVSATFSEILFTTKQIKSNGVKIWVGFDAFSLNTSRQSYRVNRMEDISNQDHVSYFFDYAEAPKAIYRKLRDFVLSREYDSQFRRRDSTTFGKNSLQEIENHSISWGYQDYSINSQELQEFANLLDTDDVILIFPKHAHYYTLFNKYQTIKEQYFKALRFLVATTKARVISFYGTNEITLETDNFDDYGWHFKPKIGELIIRKVLHLTCQSCITDSKQMFLLEGLPKNFGVELRPDNVDFYLQNLLL